MTIRIKTESGWKTWSDFNDFVRSGLSDAGSMFANDRFTRNGTTPQLDTQNVTNMGYMFSECSSLVEVPQLNTQNVTNMNGMFIGCSSLVKVSLLDAQSVTSAGHMFFNCSSLESVRLYGLSRSVSVSNTKLNATELNRLFESLGVAQGSQTISINNTPGAATCNRSIATKKGWTVSG